jgi:hypothetical protein
MIGFGRSIYLGIVSGFEARGVGKLALARGLTWSLEVLFINLGRIWWRIWLLLKFLEARICFLRSACQMQITKVRYLREVFVNFSITYKL